MIEVVLNDRLGKKVLALAVFADLKEQYLIRCSAPLAILLNFYSFF